MAQQKKKSTNKNTKTKVQEVMEKKEVKVVEEDKKSIGRIIFDVVFWVVIVALAIVWLTDFIKIQNDKDPVFCLSKKTHEFDDGTVEECTGLGYKIYDYNRDSIDAHQFGPLFIKMKK